MHDANGMNGRSERVTVAVAGRRLARRTAGRPLTPTGGAVSRAREA
jgi:hypothetical protein